MSVILFGIHPVCEALKKRPRAFHRVFMIKPRTHSPLKQIVTLAEESGIRYELQTPDNLARMTGSDNHQGVAAEVEPFPLTDVTTLIHAAGNRNTNAFYLVLDCIQDPQNFGSLIRSAVCSGVQAIVFPKDRSAQITGAVAKASAGAIEHIKMSRVVNIASALADLKKAGIWIAGTSPHGTENIYGFDFNLDLALVIGGEGKGMRRRVEKMCDFSLAIPLHGGFDSLNASTAGAVVLFEAMRQRGYGTNAAMKHDP